MICKKTKTNTYTQMLPVKLMWGHRCGLHITATTAICDGDEELKIYLFS